jgi:hypothetical protein
MAEDSDVAVEMPQLTTGALNKGLQVADDLAICLRLTVSWIDARNSSTSWRLS